MPARFFRAKAAWSLCAICILLLLNGCALWHELFGEEELTPAELMSDGLENYRDGKFKAASELFQKIKDRYPYSKYAVEAELKLADSLYERDLFEEAYDAYKEFERLHPRNPNIPYVIFREGMCFFSRSKTVDRDQSQTYKAKEEFERLIKRFRNSPYTERARKKLRDCYVNMARHEIYVGNFYFKMGKFQAAMDRYVYAIEHYPDLGQYHEALEQIKLCKEQAIKMEAEKKTWWGKLKRLFID
ncbi:MAG: outer membrane protein assembly factor BamD [Deltaproteobacteria bacterium]|jgi:outer membrane protein assembly factor BamD